MKIDDRLEDTLPATNVSPGVMAELLRESLRQGSHPLLTVTSNSMAPLLYRGDCIRLEAVDLAALQPGDVVVYVDGESLISHRYWGVVGRGAATFLTRGDRQRYCDVPWPAHQLVGRVISRSRHDHYLLLTAGPGRWLNHQLARLAGLEMAWLDPASGSPGARLGLGERMARRLAYTVALILTSAVHLFSRRS
jgi:signal peptidase I